MTNVINELRSYGYEVYEGANGNIADKRFVVAEPLTDEQGNPVTAATLEDLRRKVEPIINEWQQP